MKISFRFANNTDGRDDWHKGIMSIDRKKIQHNFKKKSSCLNYYIGNNNLNFASDSAALLKYLY